MFRLPTELSSDNHNTLSSSDIHNTLSSDIHNISSDMHNILSSSDIHNTLSSSDIHNISSDMHNISSSDILNILSSSDIHNILRKYTRYIWKRDLTSYRLCYKYNQFLRLKFVKVAVVILKFQTIFNVGIGILRKILLYPEHQPSGQ